VKNLEVIRGHGYQGKDFNPCSASGDHSLEPTY